MKPMRVYLAEAMKANGVEDRVIYNIFHTAYSKFFEDKIKEDQDPQPVRIERIAMRDALNSYRSKRNDNTARKVVEKYEKETTNPL